MDRRTAERMVEMIRALTPFAQAAEAYEGAPEDRTLIVTPDQLISVRDLRAAREAILD